MTVVLDADAMRAAQEALDLLEGEVAEVCGHLNALHARLVALTADALDTGAWAQLGVSSPSQWLAWKAGLSSSQARTVVRVAARHAELPVTMEAFAAGELSLCQVAPIAAKVPGWAEAEVCGLARYATVGQLRSVVASYPFDATVPPVDDPAGSAGREPEEHVSLTRRDDGRLRLSGLLDHDHGLLVEAALSDARDALYRRTGAPATGLDALVEIAHRSLDTISEPGRRDRYRLHLHLDNHGRCTDAQGWNVADWLRRLVGCDVTTSVTWETNGRPVATGTPHSAIPAVARRHVLRRDRCCRVPGCASRYVDIHHVIHREDHGCHDVANLVAVCPQHHRRHHRGLLGITGDAETPDGLHFTDQWGRPMPRGPTVRPPTGPPPPPARPYHHPSGERLQRWAVTFNPP